MDWDDLRYVLAITRARSLSAAGAALGVTHTTVGRRLTRLEERLGVRLFDRTPDGFVPTAAGVDLTELATETEARVHRAEARVKGLDTALDGPLRVSTLAFVFEGFTDVFTSFCGRYPSVDLTVTASWSEVSLFRREADVVLRMTNKPPETVVGRRVASVRFAVYAHRSLAEQANNWSELPWLHWDERLDPRWLDDWLAANAPGARVAMRVGEDTLVRRAAMAAAIGAHPLACFEGDAHPDLVRVGPVIEAFTRGLWVLTLPALRRTRRVRAFVDHVAEAMRAHPSALAGEDGA